mgnify:CR=1 FL=1
MCPRALRRGRCHQTDIELVSSSTILLTGGCGFLGQHVTQYLLDAFPEGRIRIIDLAANPLAYVDFSGEPRVETHLGLDIRDLASIQDAFQGVDAVVNLASVVSPSLRSRDRLEEVNVVGTRNVLAAAEAAGVDRFVQVSSAAALGYTDDPLTPADESFEFDWSIAHAKNKFYMLSKYRADVEVEASRRNGLASVIVYPGLMFGPGDHHNTAKLIRSIKAGKVVASLPGGNNVVDVRDVGRGIVTILQQGVREGNYLLSGWNLTFDHIIRTIAAEVGARPPRMILPAGLRPLLYWTFWLAESLNRRELDLSASDTDSAFRFRYFDNSKAKRALGWEPAYTFEHTIADALVWMESGGIA